MWKTLVLGSICLASCYLMGCNAPRNEPPVAAEDRQVDQTGGGDVAPDGTANAQPARPAAEEQLRLSTISLSQLNEQLSELNGKVVVLDVWSTNCVPCMQEFHNLVELSQRSSDDLVCVSLNVDYIGLPKRPPEDYLPAVKKFLTKEKAWQVRNYVAADPDSDVLDKFGIEAIPAIIVFDKGGQLAGKLTDANASGEGVTYQADVIPLVDKLLSAE